jgi:hypothetical protein
MCDYSLEYVASRQAAVADRLVTTSFSNTITRGFAAVEDVNTAVCLRPGTEIAFERDVQYEHPVTHAITRMATKVARFRQVDMHIPHAHHDALEFATGEIVPLTRLVRGQHAVVLQLPAEPQKAEEKPVEGVQRELVEVRR